MSIKRQIIEIELTGGVTVQVTPVSQPIMTREFLQAKEVHPDPDPEPFMKPIPNALDENARYLDAKDPVYQSLYRNALQRQMNLLNERLIRRQVKLSKDDQAAAEKEFKADIQAVKEEFPNAFDNWHDWQIALINFILIHPDDIKKVNQAIRWQLPVTEEEVRDGFVYFRPAD